MNGMRGVAAIAVVMWHAPLYFGLRFGSSYLAVDLFFALSGFVLAHAYEARFERGMGVASFMRLRFIRLFPLFSLGIAITLTGVVIGLAAGMRTSWTPASLAWCAGFNILFLPAPSVPSATLFPLNVPGWSLFLELFANLLYVLTWRLLSNRVLMAIMGSAAVALVFCATMFGDLGGGWAWRTLVVGVARVLYGFPAGVLIYRLARNWRPLRINALFAIAAMVLIFAIDPKSARIAYDLAAVLVVLPAIVIVASLTRPTRFIGFFSFLGTTSYAVYAIHHPIITLGNSAVTEQLGKTLKQFTPWSGLVLMAAMLCAAWLLDRWYDEPARRWMLAFCAHPANLVKRASHAESIPAQQAKRIAI
jgi:peptidoglycan/LPS O-acetylase OafA/YrhL